MGNVLLIGLQYSLSFKWPDFSLKCLQWHQKKFPISGTDWNYNSFSKPADNNWGIIIENRKERQSTVGHAHLKSVKVSAGV